MYCRKCGKKNPDDGRFCIGCGDKMYDDGNSQMVKMRCNHCGGTLQINNDRDVISCPFCGSTEIVLEGDNIKIKRIEADVEKHINDNDTELEKLKIQAKAQEERQNFLMIIFCFAVMLLLILIPLLFNV